MSTSFQFFFSFPPSLVFPATTRLAQEWGGALWWQELQGREGLCSAEGLLAAGPIPAGKRQVAGAAGATCSCAQVRQTTDRNTREREFGLFVKTACWWASETRGWGVFFFREEELAVNRRKMGTMSSCDGRGRGELGFQRWDLGSALTQGKVKSIEGSDLMPVKYWQVKLHLTQCR